MANRKWIACAITLSLTAMSAPALADDGFGKTGQIILSADRLFGLTFPSVTAEDGASGDKQTISRTDVSLLFPPLSEVQSPYEIPRAAIDFNVASGFTVGGAIGYMTSSGKSKREPAMGGMSVETDLPTLTMLSFSPRVGYALPIAPLFGFWPRVGITYFNIGTSSTSTGMIPVTRKTTTTGFGVDIEPMFVFSPVSHFGITGGPVIDIPLSGTSSTTITPTPMGPAPVDDKVKYTNYGVQFGLLGYF
jgi:hypothetical protein